MHIGNERAGFTLVCDHCERAVKNRFSAFALLVDHKKQKKWKSIKGKSGQWYEICNACAQSEDIVAKFKEM